MRHSFVEQLDENAQLGTEKSIYNLLYTRMNLGEITNSTQPNVKGISMLSVSSTIQNYKVHWPGQIEQDKGNWPCKWRYLFLCLRK